jgi:hypothetical protein
MLQVELRRGKHGRHDRKDPEREIKLSIVKLLKSVGFSTDKLVAAHLGKKVPGGPLTKGAQVPPTGLRGHAIKMLVQPGDNGTRFECTVKIPAAKGAVRSLFDRLRKAQEETTTRGDVPDAVSPGKEVSSTGSKVPVEIAPPAPADEIMIGPDEFRSVTDAVHEGAAAIAPAVEEPASPSVPASTEERKKLDVKLLTTDHDHLGILLLSLHEKEKEMTLDGRTCLRLMQAVVSSAHSLRSFPSLLEQLVRKGYVERLGKKKGCTYRLSPAGLELIGVKSSEQQKVPPVSSGQRLKQIHVLVEDYGTLKEKEEQLVSDQQKIDTEEARLQARLSTIQTLRAGIKKKLAGLAAKKEEIALQIQEALKR